jgi:acyl carrier protein
MSDELDLRAWVRGHLGRVLGIAPDLIALDRTLADYGLDSVDAVLMAGELEEAFGIEIDPAGFIQFDTIEAMVLALTPVVKAGLGRRQGT